MSILLSFLSFVVGIAFVIKLIIDLSKQRSKKPGLLGIAICAVVFLISTSSIGDVDPIEADSSVKKASTEEIDTKVVEEIDTKVAEEPIETEVKPKTKEEAQREATIRKVTKLKASEEASKKARVEKEVNLRKQKRTEEEARVLEEAKLKSEEEAEMKAEEEAKALEEAKLKLEKEAQVKAKAQEEAKLKSEKEAQDEADKKQVEEQKYNTGITREDIARDKAGKRGFLVKFSGEIVQVTESKKHTECRMAVNDDYDQMILIRIPNDKLENNILEDDKVTIEGISNGNMTYETIMGGKVTIPGIRVDNIYY